MGGDRRGERIHMIEPLDVFDCQDFKARFFPLHYRFQWNTGGMPIVWNADTGNE